MTTQTTILQKLTHKLVSNPQIYDQIQRIFGSQKTLQLLQAHFSQFSGQSVLDVGAGTGLYASLLPPNTSYIWSDLAPLKYKGFRTKIPSTPAVLCDATMIALADKSVDSAICIAVSHHIDDVGLTMLFRELARVVRKRLFFLDAVRTNHLMSKALWALDQGSYPRDETSLRLEIEKYFDFEKIDKYQVYHRYFLCTCVPKQ